MADLSGMGFDPAEVESMGSGFTIVPPGIYTVMVVKSDVADSSTGGKLLVMEYQVCDGPQTGSTLIDRLNIRNNSDVAQKIGLSQLKDVCDAIGFVGKLTDSNKLHGKPFSVKVVVEPFVSNKTGKSLDSNKIEKRMKKQAASMSEAAPAQKAANSGW
jgi:hypothetical protein